MTFEPIYSLDKSTQVVESKSLSLTDFTGNHVYDGYRLWFLDSDINSIQSEYKKKKKRSFELTLEHIVFILHAIWIIS